MTTSTDVHTTVAQMTLEEKASLCSGRDFWSTTPLERLGVRSLFLTDGPHGVRRQRGDAAQVGLDDSEPATCFPTAAALGSSWDPDLLAEVGAALGREARALGVDVLLGPGVNIKRSPLCGRNFEYFSEDPLIGGVLGAALVRSLQGQGVGASLKHYAVNNQETDRMRVDAQVDERSLREIYLAGFERVVTEARPWTVMCSYNRVNGTYASEHPWLLTTVLRDEWGFDGLVVSDWGAVNDRVAGLEAGLDLEMPASGGVNDAKIVAAVRSGDLDEAVLDARVAAILRLAERAGATAADGTFDPDAHHALARTAAGRCAVLLKNERDLLPLDPGASVAVIGEMARTPRYQGSGSSQITPTRLDDALSAIREVAASVTFAAEPAEAARAAAEADVAVVFLGLPHEQESEGFDRTHLDLPAEQLSLLAAVAGATENVVVVLSNGSAIALAGWERQAAAIVEGWLLGQAGGSAIADVLFGAVNPSGRLAETLPLRLQDTPAHLNFPGEFGQVRYGEGLFVGYRHYDALDLPVAYPFGHGLSYTTFDYRDLAVSCSGTGASTQVSVSVRVRNTGERAGREVVQVYLGRPDSAVQRPRRELKAFAVVAVEPGAEQSVQMQVPARDLAYFHPGLGRWVLEGGPVVVEVGASSRDIRLRAEITIDGEPVRAALTAESSIGEWLADPDGRRLLTEALSGDGAGPMADEAILTMIGSMPLIRMTRFPGAPLDEDGVAALVGALGDVPGSGG